MNIKMERCIYMCQDKSMVTMKAMLNIMNAFDEEGLLSFCPKIATLYGRIKGKVMVLYLLFK